MKNKINKITWLVILILLFTRTAYFMSLPFLAIYLVKMSHFTAGKVGLILGIPGLIYSGSGLYNGRYVDRNNKKSILVATLFCIACCYIGIGFTIHSFWLILLVNALLGLFRSTADITATTLLVKNSQKNELKFIYTLRSMALNTGVIIGPLIGSILAYRESLSIFIISGLICFALCFSLFLIHIPAEEKQANPLPSKLLSHLHNIWQDKTLINLTLINFLIWIIYSQIDTTLPQYLTQISNIPSIILGVMMFINAIICITLPGIGLQISEKYSYQKAGALGCILLFSGFLILTVAKTLPLFICAIIFISFGELLTLLSNGLIISKIAPKHLIASYNGFFSLNTFGLCLGPILGGYGLQYFGGPRTFLILGIFPLICIWRYLNKN